jgi:hypothetical protein
MEVRTLGSHRKWKCEKVKLSLCITKHYTMKMYGGVDVQSQIFLTSALAGGKWSASRPGCFTPIASCYTGYSIMKEKITKNITFVRGTW